MSRIFKTLAVVIAFSGPLLVYADDHVEKGVESLSPDVRALLGQEMLAIQNGMMSVISAYASGNYAEIASIAEQIKNSYVLEQDMTRQQMHELHQKLPDSFIQLDQQFHSYAGLLEEAARKNNDELIGFYFSKMVDSCADCHSQHAKHKFPAFGIQDEENTH
jgi:uncharacterized protein with von Willebrand factor type A (vWA) domain